MVKNKDKNETAQKEELKAKKMVTANYTPLRPVLRETPTLTKNTLERLALLDSILASSTEYYIIATDLNNKIITWNEGARRIFGYNPSEILGKNIDLLCLPREIKAGKIKKLMNGVHSVGKWVGEITQIRKNGNSFIAYGTITLRLSADCHPIGFTIIAQDVTINKELEERIKQQNLELIKSEEKNNAIQQAMHIRDEFLSKVVHELRIPLNAINGFSQLIYDKKVGSLTVKQKEYLGDVLSGAKSILQLINDIEDLSKLGLGKYDFHPVKVGLARLVNEVIDQYSSNIKENKLNVICEFNKALQPVFIDPNRFKQVLDNYVSNAIKFTPAYGSITIRLKSFNTQFFYLEVEDNGAGIPRYNLNHVFHEFSSFELKPENTIIPATGLGLALTKQIVEAQGGQVGVKSVLGKGSLFYAILPKKMPNLISSNQKGQATSMK